MKKIIFTGVAAMLLLTLLQLVSCSEGNSIGPSHYGYSPIAQGDTTGVLQWNGWLVDPNEVKDGGPGIDGIPALFEPEFVAADAVGSYLHNNYLVLGLRVGDEMRAYPHAILNWHEIINDTIGAKKIAVTYCPLTGSGIALNRMANGQETTFRVSGLLYNSNLIPYDRLTRSYWSQMKMISIAGEMVRTEFDFVPLIETTWGEWKKMYPETVVVSENTEISRNYDRYPYGDYTSSAALIFPVSHLDNRLHRKSRVHGIIVNGSSLAFEIGAFPYDMDTINHEFAGASIITAGSSNRNIAVSYERTLNDGTVLDFNEYENDEFPSVIMTDLKTESKWDLTGLCIDGELKGMTLKPVLSFISYWFAWVVFYPDVELYSRF